MGCAQALVLPGADAEAYRGRLEDWTETFRPRDPVESYLVGRLVHVSWQADRADRAEAARLTKAIRDDEQEEAERRTEEVDLLGRWLRRRESGPPGPVLERLEVSAAGCGWLLDRWAAPATGAGPDLAGARPIPGHEDAGQDAAGWRSG